MSHRYEENKKKKETVRTEDPEVDLMVEELENDQIVPVLEDLLLQGRKNFHCLECSHREHELEELGDGLFIRCVLCGWGYDLMSPIYRGMGHDQIIGYDLILQDQQGQGLKFHRVCPGFMAPA